MRRRSCPRVEPVDEFEKHAATSQSGCFRRQLCSPIRTNPSRSCNPLRERLHSTVLLHKKKKKKDEKIDTKKKRKIFTAAIACIKGDIIDSYATTRSIRTPCALEDDIEIRFFIDISLSKTPRGTLIVVQLPYRFGFR